MTNKKEHELDEVLKHYGVKGMKWGKKQTPAEIAADPNYPRDKHGNLKPGALEKAGYIYDDNRRIVQKNAKKAYSKAKTNMSMVKSKTKNRGKRVLDKLLGRKPSVQDSKARMNKLKERSGGSKFKRVEPKFSKTANKSRTPAETKAQMERLRKRSSKFKRKPVVPPARRLRG